MESSCFFEKNPQGKGPGDFVLEIYKICAGRRLGTCRGKIRSEIYIFAIEACF